LQGKQLDWLNRMQIQLPEEVKFIITTLETAGHEAYAVGGCVRDSIMGRIPNDWDITTSAQPEEVKALFKRTIDTGLQHGTVTVMMDKIGYEVTTYRIDGDYEDSRHPKEVTFTKSLEEDLKRRDFTVNAMAYNDHVGLVDIFGGIRDMEAGIIRCVGNAVERFTEDALRIMRAVRFSAQFGYSIEEETKRAIGLLAPNLKNISAERIQVELVKLLTSDHPDYLRIAYETGITKEFLPEFDLCMETEQVNPHHCYTVGEHILHSLSHVKADKILRLTMLLHDIGKPLCKKADVKGIDHFHGHAEKSAEISLKILRRLKFDNETIKRTTQLIRYHDWAISLTKDVSEKTIRKSIARIGEDAFPDMFLVGYADIMAQSDYFRKEKLEKNEFLEKIYEGIIKRKECLSLKDMAVTGSDLIAAGMSPGKQLGDVLKCMLEDVIETPEHNDKRYLLENIQKYRKESKKNMIGK